MRQPNINSTSAISGIKFHKLNVKRWEWRDAYHWLLTLSWPQFSVFVFGMYLAINLLFSFCYYLRPQCIAGMEPLSWANCFFFSVETLATVGYGHMYPQTLFGHLVATGEIIVGMFGMAVITGLTSSASPAQSPGLFLAKPRPRAVRRPARTDVPHRQSSRSSHGRG